MRVFSNAVIVCLLETCE